MLENQNLWKEYKEKIFMQSVKNNHKKIEFEDKTLIKNNLKKLSNEVKILVSIVLHIIFGFSFDSFISKKNSRNHQSNF